MTEWVSLLSAGAALVASLCSEWIIGWLKRGAHVVYDVALPSGKRQEIRISKSPGGGVDSTIQEVILAALNVMRNDDMNPQSTEELRRLVVELEKQRAVAPLSRLIVLLLSRAYRNLGEHQRATDILSEYITAKERDHQLDHDLADAYYNRACYLALSGQMSLAVEDLSKSIRLSPENKQSAAADPDLSSIRDQLGQILSANP